MKRKILAIACAMALAVVTSVSAFAANSPSNLPTAGNNKVEVTISADTAVLNNELGAGKAEAITAAKTADEIAAATGLKVADITAGFKDGTVKVAALFDASATLNGSTVLEFIVPGYANKAYTMYHFNGTAWEKVGSGTVGANGEVKGTFTSLSPVMVLVGDPVTTTTTGSNAGVTSPTTGAGNVGVALLSVVAVSAAALAVSAKKIKE